MAKTKRGGNGLGVMLLLIIALLAITIFVYEWRFRKEVAPTGAPTLAEDKPETLSAGFEAHFIDVGQGDCELLICGNEAMLIDAGEQQSAGSVVEYIKNLGITKLKYVVATHPHSDHIGALPDVIDAFPVENFITADVTHDTKTFENLLDSVERNGLEITIAERYDEYTLGDTKLTVLSSADKEYESMNNYSVVLRADYGKTSFLFTGDAESDAEKDMLEAGVALKSDVLKVGHHGSHSSTTKAFLNAVSPRIAVISCGLDNAYSHPHETTLVKLDKIKAEVYQTKIGGTVVVISDGKAVAVKQEKEQH